MNLSPNSHRDPEHLIADVLIRYCTAIDTKDWSLLYDSFTPDCVVTYPSRVVNGVEELVAHLEPGHVDLDGSLHRLTNIVVTVNGDSATCKSYVDVLLIRRGHPNGPFYNAQGHYADLLVLTDKGWRISQRSFVPLYSTGSHSITGR
jgi:ketosteroid isomerase-like protein